MYFPKNAKIASITPLDKDKPNKHKISNYQHYKTLNTFSKIYKKRN